MVAVVNTRRGVSFVCLEAERGGFGMSLGFGVDGVFVSLIFSRVFWGGD